MPIKKISEKIKGLSFNKLKEFYRNQIKSNKKLVLIFLLVILIPILVLLVIANLKEFQVTKKVVPIPTPTPIPIEEEIISPSSYATDSAVLAIEKDLETLDKDLLETDLYETGLNPPFLDMDVSFEEK